MPAVDVRSLPRLKEKELRELATCSLLTCLPDASLGRLLTAAEETEVPR